MTRITQAARRSSDTTHMDKRNEHAAHSAMVAQASKRMTQQQLDAKAKAAAERAEILRKLGV